MSEFYTNRGRSRIVYRDLTLPEQKWPDENPPKSTKQKQTTNPSYGTATITGWENVRVPIIYGKVRTGGIKVYERPIALGGVFVIYLLGWGPIHSVSDIRFNGQPYSSFGGSNGLATPSVHYGTTTGPNNNNAIDTIVAFYAPEWTSRLPGLAYIACYMKGVIDPDSMTCVVEGLEISDHRTDPTLATLAYSDNVAVCRADFWTNKRYGGGRDITDVDYATADQAANDCDVNIGGGVKRFRIGLKISDQKDWEEWDKHLRLYAQMFDGYYAGKHQMFVEGVQTTSSIVINEADVIEAKLKDNSRDQVPDKVVFTYTDQANDFNIGDASVEDVGIGTGTITDPIISRYDSPGSPSFDQSKRLALWAYNKTRIDDMAALDITYDKGIYCVPGLIITITSSKLDWTNQLARIRSVSDRDDLSFTIQVERYNSGIYSDIIQTTATVSPTANGDPYADLAAPTGVTVTPVVDEMQPGSFVTKVMISFTPDTSEFYGGTRFTVQVNGGTIVELPVVLTGPIGYIISEGVAATVLVKGYSVHKITNKVSTLFSSNSTTTYDPSNPEPIGYIYYYLGAGLGGPDPLDKGTAYWSKPPNRVRTLYGGSSWSATGTTLFTAANVNNGSTVSNAVQFNSAVTGELVLDLGLAKQISEFEIFSATLNTLPIFGVYYSDNGSSWTLATTLPEVLKNTANTAWRYILDPLQSGTHRYWKLTKNATAYAGFITEVQPVEYNGTYPYTKGYRLNGIVPIVNNNGNDGLSTSTHYVDIFYHPTVSNTVDMEQFKQYVTTTSLYSFQQIWQLYFNVKVISSKNAVSTEYTEVSNGTQSATALFGNPTTILGELGILNRPTRSGGDYASLLFQTAGGNKFEFGLDGDLDAGSGDRLTIYDHTLSAYIAKFYQGKFKFGSGSGDPLDLLHLDHISPGTQGVTFSWLDGNYRNKISNVMDGSTAVNNKIDFLVCNATTTGTVTPLSIRGDSSSLFRVGTNSNILIKLATTSNPWLQSLNDAQSSYVDLMVDASTLYLQRSSGGGVVLGSGGIGTNQAYLYMDSGSGSGGYSWVQFNRNGVEKGAIGVSGTTGGGVSGIAAGDMFLRSTSRIAFSLNTGGSKHVDFNVGLYKFGIGGTGNQNEGLQIEAGSGGSGGSPYIQFLRNTNEYGLLGVNGVTAAFSAGTAQYDVVLRSTTRVAIDVSFGSGYHSLFYMVSNNFVIAVGKLTNGFQSSMIAACGDASGDYAEFLVAKGGVGHSLGIGVSGTGAALISGAADFDGAIRTIQRLSLSADLGSTLHASLNNSGIWDTWNGAATEGQGVAPIRKVVSLTNQSAAITTTTLLTSPPAGDYIVSFYTEITQAATTSSALNDPQFQFTAAVATTIGGLTFINTNVIGDRFCSQYFIKITSGNLTYSVGYNSTGATPMKFALDITVQRIK